MGFRKLTVGPRHHEQDLAALAVLKKPPHRRECNPHWPARVCLPPGTAIKVSWQDAARAGEKSTQSQRETCSGTRPSAPQDWHTAYAYIFEAIYPQKEKAAGSVLPSWGR